MKKLIRNIIILLAILIVLDRLFGTILDNFFYHQKHGDDFVSMQLIDQSKSDILIFGSSRASHHFIPDSLESYSGLTVYNGGRDNMGIHYVQATLKEVLNRYTPKIIIIDIIPYNYIKGSQDITSYFETQSSALMPFANKHPGLYSSIYNWAPNEVIKAKCIKMYAYNSLAGSIFQNAFTNIGHPQIKGYEPLYDSLNPLKCTEQTHKVQSESNGLDTSSFHLLEQTIEMCHQKNVKVVLTFSPFYFPHKTYTSVQNYFNKIVQQHHCYLADYTSDSTFTMQPNLFYDELHLNNNGAVVLGKKLYQDALKNIIQLP